MAHANTIKQDGPTLIWKLLTEYHGTSAQIIRYQRVKIDAFNDKFRYVNGDIDKFCEHVRITMESLKVAEGTDNQAFDKSMKLW